MSQVCYCKFCKTIFIHWGALSANAIWWSAISGRWVIGSASGIEDNTGGLFSNDSSNSESNCPQQVSKWIVVDVWGEFVGVDSSDVSFACKCFGCDKVNLFLSDTAAANQGSRSGSYEESTSVNGKQAWISANGNAIWWISSSGKWVIGQASAIGSNVGGLFSDDPSNPDSGCPQNVTKWKVWNGNAFIQVDSKEVSFGCPELKGTLEF